jgi:hypothetical protein
MSNETEIPTVLPHSFSAIPIAAAVRKRDGHREN